MGPGDQAHGPTAGSLTPEEELALFLKDRRENVARNIRPALRAGRIVVLDRYYFSTIAYQGAKGLDPERIRRLNERFAPKPDLVFILDLGAGDGLARIAGREGQRRAFRTRRLSRQGPPDLPVVLGRPVRPYRREPG